MNSKIAPIRLLLVDDEDDFRRATSQVLARRGFAVQDAESGERALELIRESPPEVVILDLKMGGMDGIVTLTEIRKIAPALPVIILTGHGRAEDAFAGIKLEIVDFLQKPVDLEKLATRVRALLADSRPVPLREKSIPDIFIPPTAFPRVREDASLEDVVMALQQSMGATVFGTVSEQGYRTILVYDQGDQFIGVIRLQDIIRLVIPAYLRLPQSSCFTGMFLSELKTLGRRTAGELIAPPASVSHDAPLMEAVHILLSRRLTSLPVLDGDKLVGLVTDQAVFQEIAASVLGEHGQARAVKG